MSQEQVAKVNTGTGEVAQEKAPRTFTDIQNEFGALCARAGHLQYQIFTFKKDLELINGQVRDLNLEAAALKAKEAAAEKKAE